MTRAMAIQGAFLGFRTKGTTKNQRGFPCPHSASKRQPVLPSGRWAASSRSRAQTNTKANSKVAGRLNVVALPVKTATQNP